ncbi:MAG TPA: 16S/23S rRNA (cytidine-2'-O)-methyltransferase [Actinobacteria bacterium]|nr:16S/23S rRNA (cytidine-2'-O)-methyltransferase [Actinomycetota bacterium]
MAVRRRLDAELVHRGLARSREVAVDLIHQERVLVQGTVATKPARQVQADDSIVVRTDDNDPGYASRGGYKLAGALDAFEELQVANRRCLDAGASTGGFTDVLLRRGAAQVVAADVGYGLLSWSLRNDDRVDVKDRTNVRSLTPELIGGSVDVVVADLSFIALGIVLPALSSCLVDDGDLLVMVKPQFEVGKQRLGAGGVVRDPALRESAVLQVAHEAAALGWGTAGVVASSLPGPSGNVEYFLWLRRDAKPPNRDDVATAVREGPQ